MDLKNQTVNFRICDIFYPDYQQVLFGLHGNDVLRGRVIDLSVERLTGDTTSMIRVDIWDQLKSHIETAEKQFQSQAGTLPKLLSAFEKPPGSLGSEK